MVALLLILACLGQSGAALAQSAPAPSGSGRMVYGTGSVLATAVYTPLKTGLCALGLFASAFAFLLGPGPAAAVAERSCKGTWVITPEILKGEAPLDVAGEAVYQP
jgi:hypothetical protein